MSGNRKLIKILSVLFHSLAIAIIVFGSIINFHQYKIWGKPLIPQFVGIKRDADKASILLASGNPAPANSFTQKLSFHSATVLPVEITRHSSGPSGMITFDLTYKVPELRHLTASGLRAPPLA